MKKKNNRVNNYIKYLNGTLQVRYNCLMNNKKGEKITYEI